MNQYTEMLMEKWQDFCQKIQPGMDKAGQVMGKIGHIIKLIGIWIIRLRKIFMAIPVVYYALKLALYCSQNLPEYVGLNLQASGEFAQIVSRSTAVTGCLGVTACCLLLMFCSRRALYPWLISIFSLVMPMLLILTNQFPA